MKYLVLRLIANVQLGHGGHGIEAKLTTEVTVL